MFEAHSRPAIAAVSAGMPCKMVATAEADAVHHGRAHTQAQLAAITTVAVAGLFCAQQLFGVLLTTL